MIFHLRSGNQAEQLHGRNLGLNFQRAGPVAVKGHPVGRALSAGGEIAGCLQSGGGHIGEIQVQPGLFALVVQENEIGDILVGHVGIK